MLRLLKIVTVFVPALVLGASVAVSADDPIAARKALMQGNGTAMKAVVPMLKGEIEYNPVVAELAMRHLEGTGFALPKFFPDDSKTGDTKAAPAIWERRAEFEAAAEKLAKTSMAAVEAAKGGLDSFKASFGAVAENCKNCHQEFRLE